MCGVGAAAAIVTALHPPWIAQAIRNRMSFEGFPAVPPSTVIDTVGWSIPFAAVYRRPSIDLPLAELSGYQRRLRAGDNSAADEWRRRTEEVERQYRVPAELKSVWIGDTTAASANRGIAFRRSIVFSSFEVDRRRLSIYLAAIIAGTLLLAALLSRVANHNGK